MTIILKISLMRFRSGTGRRRVAAVQLPTDEVRGMNVRGMGRNCPAHAPDLVRLLSRWFGFARFRSVSTGLARFGSVCERGDVSAVLPVAARFSTQTISSMKSHYSTWRLNPFLPRPAKVNDQTTFPRTFNHTRDFRRFLFLESFEVNKSRLARSKEAYNS